MCYNESYSEIHKGKNIMAYINTNEVKAIRQGLKKEFGNEIKFSVRKCPGSYSVSVSIMESSVIDFSQERSEINHYQIETRYKNEPVKLEVFKKVIEIIKTAPGSIEGGTEWYDSSNSMIDYFDIAFYFNISVGSYKKEYKFVPRS